MQHRSEDIGIARFAPHDPTDLGIDIGGHEGGDSGVMTSQAECEIILQLLLGREIGAQNVPPVGENSEKAAGRVAHFDKAARFRYAEARFQEWRSATDLHDKGLRGNPLGPGVPGCWRYGVRQTSSMARLHQLRSRS